MKKASNENDYLRSAYPFAVIRERLNRHSGPVLEFAIGRRTEPPPAWLPDFVREHSDLAMGRRRQDELDAFVEKAVATLETVYGVQVSADSVLPAPSGRAAMSALAAALVAPGDTVLVTEPGYPAFARLAAQRHARLAVVSLDPEREFAMDLDSLGDADSAVRIAALNYPNNPTGSVIGPDGLNALRKRLGPEAVIFNDGIYGPLTYERPPLSLLGDESAGDGGTAILELHSLGKLFSSGPLGIAFIVGPPDLIGEIRQFSDYAWTQMSSLQVRVATRCLEDWAHVDEVRDGTGERLTRLRRTVEKLGFEPFASPAGMYLLCRGPAKVGNRNVASAQEAANLLLNDHALAVAPWDVGPHSYVRFSTAYLPEELDALSELPVVVSS